MAAAAETSGRRSHAPSTTRASAFVAPRRRRRKDAGGEGARRVARSHDDHRILHIARSIASSPAPRSPPRAPRAASAARGASASTRARARAVFLRAPRLRLRARLRAVQRRALAPDRAQLHRGSLARVLRGVERARRVVRVGEDGERRRARALSTASSHVLRSRGSRMRAASVMSFS